MTALKQLTITIECVPKTGKADKLDAALWAAIQKYTKRQQPQSIHTKYIYEGAE